MKKLLLILTLLFCCTASVIGGSYYKVPPQFHSWPDENGARYTISRFGPVGVGFDLLQPAFTMRINNVEPGSPSDGKLKKGQYVESINGVTLKDKDPRIILGDLITKIEATDGVVRFMIKDKPESPASEVIVNIPALGAYGDTWPVNCEKSGKIVQKFADFLAKNQDSISIGIDGSLLFMLSTGEEKDLQVARRWVKKLVAQYKDTDQITTYPWFIGYSGPALCEYYLKTGDKTVIPVIEKIADSAKRNMYNGAWGGRNGCPFGYMGGGHMNATGVHVVTFLLLAKECGAYVDEYTLQLSSRHRAGISVYGWNRQKFRR